MSLFDMTVFTGETPPKKISTNPFATNNNDPLIEDSKSKNDIINVENVFIKYVNSLEESEEEDIEESIATDSAGLSGNSPPLQQSSVISNFLSTNSSSSQNSLILSTDHVYDDDDKDKQKKIVKKENIDWFVGSEQEIPDDELFKSATISIENESNIKSDNVDDHQSNDIDVEQEQQTLSSALAFDCGSPKSLSYFLQQNPITSINFHPQQQLQKSLKKSFSTASIVSTGSPYCDTISTGTSPITINNSNMMNVASKKRGLFSRGSKTITGGSSLGANATSSTTINDNHQEENGKINKTPSSPSGASHHFNELDEDRFNGDGVQFHGKLIGHEYVPEARGEQMCQQSLKKLKIIQKALGGHKRKINLFISFDGIKILDPQTNEELFHHSVPQISFISRDETDTRAFGYVFGNSQTGHQFIGIKTKKEAMVVMSTIGQLFAITLKRKRNAEQEQTASTVAPVILSGEEHLYHSVPDQSSSQTVEMGNNNNDLDSNQTKSCTQRLASSYDWAHFDDDHNQLSIKDDSTLNTISSISDTLTFDNNQQTLNDSVTLVAGQQQQQYSTNQKFQMNSKAILNSQNKLNVSSTTISSANFDGMDPFSDAFGSDPFSVASTTADISSNVFSARTPHQNQQQQNRPPSNPGPNTMFDSNKLIFKEMNSGSVPTLTNSFGSLSLDKSQQSLTNNQNSNDLFKSNVELSQQNSNSQADKYAVLADINSISSSIFDSLDNRPTTLIERDDNNKNKTPTPPPATLTQQRNYPTGIFIL
ncbi:Phosphotyrosine-binding disabled-like protein [Euroglyphus maynei]|uniref:Phosphotyrosine-binding disabled-like protein n=1 Tax=Euroglyphus maynei TaxID=6958 RepID=A0A1Y3AQF0_EURMA|nr:Phosphotyrosine-binding disabled-like protein [Euroglyphus maynei]